MKKKIELGRPIVFLILLIIVLIWALPIFWGILTSMKPENEIRTGGFSFLPKHWTLENYVEVATNTDNTPIIRWIFNSLVMSTITAIFTVLLVSITAYGYSMLNFKGRDKMFYTIMAISLFPTIINIIPLYQIVSTLGWVNNMRAVIAPSLGSVTYVFLVRQFCLTLPKEYAEAARIDGVGEFGTFIWIIFPLIRPVLTVVALFSFTAVWNDFLWPSIVLNDVEKLTLTSGLKLLQGAYGSFHIGPILAGACMALVPPFLLFLFTQRYFLQSLSLSSGIKG